MKVTVDSLMNGKHLPLTINNIKVFLDGKEVNYCVAADSDNGWITKFIEPITVDPEDEECLLTETLYGKVEIRDTRTR